jgi:hypothetical protein
MNAEVEKALNSVSAKNKEVIANMLGTMNWHDAASWDELEDLLKDLGEGSNTTFKTFISNAKEAANALDFVDLNNLTNELVNMYETLQNIQNSSSREFSKEEYDEMVKGDESLKNQFVALGDKMVYIGKDLNSLEKAITNKALADTKIAEAQLEAAEKVSAAASGVEGVDDAKTYYTELAASNSNIDSKKSVIGQFF